MQSPSSPVPRAETQRPIECDAIRQRYTDLARQFADQARQIASAADESELRVPAQYIPTRRWQTEYDRALVLHRQSVDIYRLADSAFQSCADSVSIAEPQRPSARGREIPRPGGSQPRRTLVPVEAP